MILDNAGDEDDALLQEQRKDVVGALAAVGLLDDHRHERGHFRFVGIAHFFFLVFFAAGLGSAASCSSSSGILKSSSVETVFSVTFAMASA